MKERREGEWECWEEEEEGEDWEYWEEAELETMEEQEQLDPGIRILYNGMSDLEDLVRECDKSYSYGYLLKNYSMMTYDLKVPCKIEDGLYNVYILMKY